MQQIEIEFLCKNFANVQQDFEAIVDKMVEGEYPHASEVTKKIFRKLAKI